jgi:hypothetical protein
LTWLSISRREGRAAVEELKAFVREAVPPDALNERALMLAVLQIRDKKALCKNPYNGDLIMRTLLVMCLVVVSSLAYAGPCRQYSVGYNGFITECGNFRVYQDNGPRRQYGQYSRGMSLEPRDYNYFYGPHEDDDE